MFKSISNLIFKKRNKKLSNYKCRIQSFFKAGYDENQYQRNDIPYLKDLGITDIKLKKDVLIITLERPGLLIGKKGKTFDELYKYLFINDKHKLKIVESKLWFLN